MSAELKSATLTDVFGSRRPKLPQTPLTMGIDLERVELRAPLPAGQTPLHLTIGFSLEHEGVDVLFLEAGFRLVYVGVTARHREEVIALARARGVADVWPFWLSWLHGQLAVMRLPVTGLPAKAPDELLGSDVDAAWDAAVRHPSRFPVVDGRGTRVHRGA